MGSDKIHRIIINFKLGNDTKTSRRATIGSTAPSIFNLTSRKETVVLDDLISTKPLPVAVVAAICKELKEIFPFSERVISNGDFMTTLLESVPIILIPDFVIGKVPDAAV